LTPVSEPQPPLLTAADWKIGHPDEFFGSIEYINSLHGFINLPNAITPFTDYVEAGF
jgi:hypothetical protein